MHHKAPELLLWAFYYLSKKPLDTFSVSAYTAYDMFIDKFFFNHCSAACGGSSMFVIRDFAKLHEISHIIWDIDGTITDENGEVSQEVAAKIIQLGLEGIYQSFITGRDADWIIKKVIEPMKKFYNFDRVRDNLIFDAESGCVTLEVGPSKVQRVVNPSLIDHPLKTNASKTGPKKKKGKLGIRDRLKALAFNPENLGRYNPAVKLKPHEEVIYDANCQGWIIDTRKPRPVCHPYVWSTSKEVFATFEKVRDENGHIKTFDQESYVQLVHDTIADAGFADLIDVEVISTALNIVPKVNGTALGKSWAAGSALLNIWRNKLGEGMPLEEVIRRTISAGDGAADLNFTLPIFPSKIQETLRLRALKIIFVGREKDLPSKGSAAEVLKENIIIQATGQGDLAFISDKNYIGLHTAIGARVITRIVDFLKLWGYFRHF